MNRSSSRAGASMAVASMLCVQLGLAASIGLIDDLGSSGAAWLRLTWGAVILLVIVRPRRSTFTRDAVGASVGLGVATAGATILFMESVSRLPLGTASALEFLGPLGVAIARGRGVARLWALAALVGVLLLTQPWAGTADPVGVAYALAAAVCWASYIVLTQKVGDKVSGIGGLAISMPVAALVASVVAGPAVISRLTPELILIGLGLALLLPVVPFALELLALRRLTTVAFGTMMSLEPAFALLIGFAALQQTPNLLAALAIGLVVAAGIGAERSGGRGDTPKLPGGTGAPEISASGGPEGLATAQEGQDARPAVRS